MLFQINWQNKSKITEIDKALVNLQDKILKESPIKEDSTKSVKPFKERDDGERREVQQKSEEAMKVLEGMQL